MTDLENKIRLYEAEITRIVHLLHNDLREYERQYRNKEYAPTDIINLADYFNTVIWQLNYSRDRLVGISHDIEKDVFEQAQKEKDKENKNDRGKN